MNYVHHAPSRWDRFLCLVLHRHQRWTRNGYLFRNCLTPGCGMLCRRPTLWTVLTTPFRRRVLRDECDEVRRVS